MPKAGSSAHAQGRHCALTIATALDGKSREPVALESVCYSLLSGERALAIHARFRVVADAIQQLPADEGATRVSAGEEARNAADWYRRLLTDSFG
jgi:Flavocytochrome c sulphide dehydrogenase, flavin-binding